MVDFEGDEQPLQLKVNTVLAKYIWLRGSIAIQCEVVIEDPLVGVFTLHNEFDLLLKEEGSEWRSVGLDELRRVLAARTCFEKSKSKAIDRQPAEQAPHRASHEVSSDCPTLLRMGEVTGLDACIQRVEAALYRASIPYLRSALTFVVPSILHARKVLRQSGLYPHPQHESIQVDAESGSPSDFWNAGRMRRRGTGRSPR